MAGLLGDIQAPLKYKPGRSITTNAAQQRAIAAQYGNNGSNTKGGLLGGVPSQPLAATLPTAPLNTSDFSTDDADTQNIGGYDEGDGISAADLSSEFDQSLLTQNENSAQKYQRDAAKPYRARFGNSSSALEFHARTGRIDARAPAATPPQGLTSGGLGPGNRGGFTPNAEWDAGFTPQIQIPQASRPSAGYSWEKY